MALQTRLQFVGADGSGRVITVRDNTGIYSSTNTTGYNTPNLNISNIHSILFTISEFDSATIYKLRFVRTADTNHPEYLTSPSINDIASGSQNVEFTSIVLGITKPQDGLKTFTDAVYDINMYTLFGQTSISYIEDKTIYGINMDTIQNTVDFIVINNNIYTIDKSVAPNSLSITVVEDIQAEDQEAEQFYQAYRANTKGINTANSDCCGNQEAGKLASDNCGCSDKKFTNLFKLWMYKVAATIDFNCSNYSTANELIKAAQKVCKSLNCKC